MLPRNLSLFVLLTAVVLLSSADNCNNFAVNVTPASTSVMTGATTILTASATNASGNVTYSWAITDSTACSNNCGSLSATGGTNVTYTAPAGVPPGGGVTVTVTGQDQGGDSASATASINIKGIVSVSVTPAAFSFTPGGTSQPFAATVVNDPTGKGVMWSLSLSGVDCTAATAPCGTLSNATSTSVTYNPPYSAATAEQVALTATPVFDTQITASAILSISAGNSTPLTVSVSPSTQTVLPGGAPVTFAATLNGTGSSQGVTWALSQNGTACSTAASSPCGVLSNATETSVSYTPPASASSSSTVTLTAASVANASVTSSATITIQPPTLSSITVTPASASIQVGQTEAFTATGTYSDNSMQNITSTVTWASSNTSVASINSSGVATAGGSTGSTNITATLGSVVGSATLQVTSASAGVVPRYLFEFNTDGTVSSYAVVASTGQLRSVTRFTLPPGFIDSAVLNPKVDVLYLIQPNNTTGGNATVTTLAVTPAGQISNAGSNFNGNLDGYQGSVVADPLGRYLFGTDNVDSEITVYTLDPATGLPTLGTGTSLSTPGKKLAIDPSGTYLYVANANGLVLGYQIGTGGSLTAVGSSPTTALMAPGPLLVDPSGSYLFAIDDYSIPLLYVYSISNGNLTSITGSPFTIGSGGAGISQIAADPNGPYLYAIDEVKNLFGYTYGANGLTAITGSPFAGPSAYPTQLSVDPSGSYVYVAYDYTQEVWCYSIGGASAAVPGALTVTNKMRLRTSVSDGQLIMAGPTAVTFTPQYLYVANSGTATIGEFGIDAPTGALTSLGTPVAAGTAPYDVVADSNPALPFVYAANQGSNNISGYQIGSNGLLTALPDSPYAAGNAPEWLAMDPSGTYLFNVNSADATLAGFEINTNSGSSFGDPENTLLGGSTDPNPVHVSLDPNGLFAFAVNSPAGASNGTVNSFLLTGTASPNKIAAGYLPSVGAVHPSGEYYYVANGDNTISEYSVNASTGALTSIGTVTVAPAGSANYNSLTIEPSGSYLYFADQSGNLIYVFSIDPGTGALTVSSASPVSTGTAPYGLAVDISGSYLFVSNDTSNDISIFSIDLTNGSLSPVGSTTVPTGGTSPRGMTATGILQ